MIWKTEQGDIWDYMKDRTGGHLRWHYENQDQDFVQYPYYDRHGQPIQLIHVSFLGLAFFGFLEELIHFRGTKYCRNCFASLLKRGPLQKKRICSPWQQILFFQDGPLIRKVIVCRKANRKWITVDSRYLEFQGNSLKYFEISVPRHIRFEELRKNNSINHI